ncbi:MAG: type II toxin-antitoxin system VapC family toxin [Chloroflexi bacterium]|nr:type II toxin-antitoxin system VapC family toxin [Chloroflexota bacterium]
MRLLLDTHAIIWWFAGNPILTTNTQQAIADTSNDKFISAASAWEIATKYRIGKLPDAKELVEDFRTQVGSQGFIELPVSLEHAVRAGSLPGPHRDPFDRILIAQAIIDDLTLVSNETLFDSYGVRRMW